MISKYFSPIGFKLFVGVIFASTIVFSIIQLGEIYQTWLSRFENAALFQTISFSVVLLAGLVALYFLFNSRGSTKASPQIIRNPTSTNIINPQSLAFRFAEGIVEGFSERIESRNRETARAINDSSQKLLN